MSIHTCKSCEWYQPLRMLDNGRMIYGCAYTHRRHSFMLDCPKYAHRRRSSTL